MANSLTDNKYADCSQSSLFWWTEEKWWRIVCFLNKPRVTLDTGDKLKYPQHQSLSILNLWLKQSETWLGSWVSQTLCFYGSNSHPTTHSLLLAAEKAQIRELLVGDYTKIAALMPRWKNHLLGDEAINPFLMDENQQFNPVMLISLMVGRVMEEWDFERNCPTGFALSFYQTIKEFLGNPDEIEINDFLNSRPEELIDLIFPEFTELTWVFYEGFGQVWDHWGHRNSVLYSVYRAEKQFWRKAQSVCPISTGDVLKQNTESDPTGGRLQWESLWWWYDTFIIPICKATKGS